MKTQALLASIALALAGSAFAAGEHNHAHEHKPLHGGLVVEVKDMDYELVAKPTVIQLHLRDHGKPAGDKLEATGTFKVGPGTKVVALVTIAGKPAGTVRFALK
jgi:hypothetical protein